MITSLKNNKGFTLIETLIALMVFTIGILALNRMQFVSIRGNSNASGITSSSSWAAGQVEQLLRLDYADAILDDDDGDGTNQDTNDDGDDNVGADFDFGLNDIGAGADGTASSPDNNYTIYWNVAVDEPMPNLKTIRVIVTRNYFGFQKKVSLDYCKINTF
jgi:prepilin-type N-terminal cleavage/methylation domain-containing protein